MSSFTKSWVISSFFLGTQAFGLHNTCNRLRPNPSSQAASASLSRNRVENAHESILSLQHVGDSWPTITKEHVQHAESHRKGLMYDVESLKMVWTSRDACSSRPMAFYQPEPLLDCVQGLLADVEDVLTAIFEANLALT